MSIELTAQEKDLLAIAGEAAAKLGIPAYAVGGFVRDKILGRPTKDADIVTTGDGIELAQAVADQLTPRPPVSFFKYPSTERPSNAWTTSSI
jgi:tRNA nucleotidyltransferase/poly(A) polymerase